MLSDYFVLMNDDAKYLKNDGTFGNFNEAQRFSSKKHAMGFVRDIYEEEIELTLKHIIRLRHYDKRGTDRKNETGENS